MDFKTILDSLPSIDGLTGLDVTHNGNVIHHIPAVAGKLGSLRVYNALAEKFNGKLNRHAAEQGVQWFAEHSDDAKINAGKHPNIDLLFKVIAEDLDYQLIPLK